MVKILKMHIGLQNESFLQFFGCKSRAISFRHSAAKTLFPPLTSSGTLTYTILNFASNSIRGQQSVPGSID